MSHNRDKLVDRIVAAVCAADEEATEASEAGRETFWNVDKYENILRRNITHALEVKP